MSEIFLERQWDPPLSDGDFRALLDRSGGCLDLHRVTWRGSMLSLDGRNLLCHFSAPDAESVRIAIRELGSPPGRTWTGAIHEAPDPAQEAASANVVVSREFDEPVAFEEVQALEDAGQGCLDMHRVSFVRTFFSADRKRMICLYHAPDAESVRIAQRDAGMPVDAIWAYRRYAPVDPG